MTRARFSPRKATVSMGLRPAGATMPSALGICPVRIMAPTPQVKPAMTDTGTSLAYTPALVTPLATCMPPARQSDEGEGLEAVLGDCSHHQQG